MNHRCLRLEEDEARIAALCAAVDEGDAGPDVMASIENQGAGEEKSLH